MTQFNPEEILQGGELELYKLLKKKNAQEIPHLGIQASSKEGDAADALFKMVLVIKNLSSVDSEDFARLCGSIAQHIEKNSEADVSA